MPDSKMTFKHGANSSVCSLNFILNGFNACHTCVLMLKCDKAITNIKTYEIIKEMRDMAEAQITKKPNN